jgi:hypothetical protein
MKLIEQPRFLPLVCPDCSDDLAGRAEDVVAFCSSCDTAWRCDGDALERWPAGRVTEVPAGEGAVITLPFWVLGPVALPAFFGSRPLTAGRIVARGLADLRATRGAGRLLPVGARVPPESVAKVAPLLGCSSPPASNPVLLALPVRVGHKRLALPGGARGLFPDDVHELPQLLERAGALSARAGEPEPQPHTNR